jgi:hypothetical protein
MKEIKKGKERIEPTDNLLLFSLWELLPCSSILLSRCGLDHNMTNCGCKHIVPMCIYIRIHNSCFVYDIFKITYIYICMCVLLNIYTYIYIYTFLNISQTKLKLSISNTSNNISQEYCVYTQTNTYIGIYVFNFSSTF